MKNNKSWYSVILAVLMVWFMIVLTSWVFLLVLWENKDTKAMEYYLKSFSRAEWSVELALLKAKKYNYSYSEKLVRWDNLSKTLFRDNSLFKFNKDVFISYDLDATTSNIENKILAPLEFDIIPLFSYNSNWDYVAVKNIKSENLNDDIVFNIIWENSWISWVWNINNSKNWNYKTVDSNWEVNYEEKNIGDFLNISTKNYLILHNTWNNEVKYNLKSINPNEFLTKAKSLIIWSWEVWWYKQNLRVTIDNSKYLNLLKYSIFSN